jgi:dTDP-4-dehydrorhamnose reductase
VGAAGVAEATPDHVILRTAWVYSPYGTNFVRTMMRLGAEQGSVRVVADQRGNPTSAADVAGGVLRLVRRWAAGGGDGLGRIYHLAGTGETSWAGFAEAIFECCAQDGLPFAQVEPIPTAAWPTRAPRPANSTLDSTRFATDFDYRMPHWKSSLATVVRALAETARAD